MAQRGRKILTPRRVGELATMKKRLKKYSPTKIKRAKAKAQRAFGGVRVDKKTGRKMVKKALKGAAKGIEAGALTDRDLMRALRNMPVPTPAKRQRLIKAMMATPAGAVGKAAGRVGSALKRKVKPQRRFAKPKIRLLRKRR
jgi:hypothetical protein